MGNRLKIYEILQNQAIADKLTKNDMFFFRKICRWYSEKFHTPLHEVMEGKTVLWADILQHYYESQFENLSHNETLELAKTEYLPDFIEEMEEDNQRFAEELVEEQKRTVAKKKKKKEIVTDENFGEKLVESAKEALDHAKGKKKLRTTKAELKPPPPMNFNFEDENE